MAEDALAGPGADAELDVTGAAADAGAELAAAENECSCVFSD